MHAATFLTPHVALQADEPAWPAHEDFVFTIHPNSKEQLVLTLLQSDRLRFFKYGVCRSKLSTLEPSLLLLASCGNSLLLHLTHLHY
jgi:hypothetical protein